MSKEQTRYSCQSCGAVFSKWLGRCTTCGEWNTLAEEVVQKASKSARARTAKAQRVSEISLDDHTHIPTGISELDRVLGGGVVLGGVTLVGGDPGVGKSTLLMQALGGLAKRKMRVLYISGEESASQTAARARRLEGVDPEAMLVLSENDLDAIDVAITEVKPHAIVVDSVQTVRAPGLESAMGSVSQLREVAQRVIDRSKRENIATFLVGHVTKDGALAGPKVLEHLVDTVLTFGGDRGHRLRTLRAQKNRFGSATEVGVFEMNGFGLREVPSPSALFLAERPKGVSGSVIAATGEGARALLVEVQALVVSGSAGRRTVNGVDSGRLSMILAVLERKAGLTTLGCDVFVNLAGGASIDEPALDLPLALALASSIADRVVPVDVVAFGEIGLSGEVRSVDKVPLRLAEAAAMGFARAIAPAGDHKDSKIEVVPVRMLSQAIDALGL